MSLLDINDLQSKSFYTTNPVDFEKILWFTDLFLGDIKLFPGIPEAHITPLGSVVDRRRLWPNNTVYYIIDEPTYSKLLKA